MKFIITSFVLIFNLLIVPNAYAGESVDYYITHQENKLIVNVTVNSKIPNFNKLYIPGKIWGTDYFPLFKNLKITEQGGKKTYRYEILSRDKKNLERDFYDRRLHFIEKDQFFLFGLGAFIIPESLLKKNTKVNIVIETPIHKVFNNYGSSNVTTSNKITLKAKELDGLFIMAKNDLMISNDPKHNLSSVSIGLEPEVFNKLHIISQETLGKQLAFWNSGSSTRKKVIIVPFPGIDSHNRWSGTVIGDSIICFINPHKNTDEDRIQMMSHEGNHFWFGDNLISGPIWFSEGFTDYYRDKILYYNTNQEALFFEKYNKKLKSYFLSPVKNLPEELIQQKHFDLSIINKLPYIKGYVIAGQIDSVINLDQALKSMFKKCAKEKKGNMKHVCEFSTDYLLSFVPDATMEQKNQIALVAGALSPENLAPKFLNKTTLKMMGTKKLYDIDIASIIDRGMVEAKIFNDKSKNHYPLIDVAYDCRSMLYIKYSDKGKIKSRYVPEKHLKNEIYYPQYE